MHLIPLLSRVVLACEPFVLLLDDALDLRGAVLEHLLHLGGEGVSETQVLFAVVEAFLVRVDG